MQAHQVFLIFVSKPNQRLKLKINNHNTMMTPHPKICQEPLMVRQGDQGAVVVEKPKTVFISESQTKKIRRILSEWEGLVDERREVANELNSFLALLNGTLGDEE
ncbi:hypothetical protein RF11_10048 [Thelohanellus kitauei]|uniref:Uncharacterized protein n=1 Tax=Thelohanellus kitauei TaxID=669202 RepID=A0A0C2MMQ3_THEKT|nr:hypothetical protein RF11_10048 [Thelohanellus kitauei]